MFVRVAGVEDVRAGRGVRVYARGIAIGLYRVGERYYAMEDDCPHAGFPLSEGELSGTVITCAAHGFDYDVTSGFKPGYEDGFPIPCFPVRVEDAGIFVDVVLPDDDD
ncbi:MAG: Rieske 2Fe-2S domain-containing protein [Myxococcales bacterium]|nr:Rieske 2Fe-2S domain-containing protein [Myxococcales bacterium]